MSGPNGQTAGTKNILDFQHFVLCHAAMACFEFLRCVELSSLSSVVSRRCSLCNPVFLCELVGIQAFWALHRGVWECGGAGEIIMHCFYMSLQLHAIAYFIVVGRPVWNAIQWYTARVNPRALWTLSVYQWFPLRRRPEMFVEDLNQASRASLHRFLMVREVIIGFLWNTYCNWARKSLYFNSNHRIGRGIPGIPR